MRLIGDQCYLRVHEMSENTLELIHWVRFLNTD